MMLGMVCLFAVLFLLIFRRLKDRYAPVQTVKAQVVDKYVADQFSQIYGSMARSPNTMWCLQRKRRSMPSGFPNFLIMAIKSINGAP